MRKYIIAANWKMHKTEEEAVAFIDDVSPKLRDGNNSIEAVVCSAPLFLSKLVEQSKSSNLKIGAQTMHYEDQGAFTGEVSPVALEKLGVEYVIIGHSERRELFNETDSDVNKKVHAAFNHNLIPILCCGESLDEREVGKTNDVVEQQIKIALAELNEDQIENVVVAYEPIWAIGTGKSSSPSDANSVCKHIRTVIGNQFGTDKAKQVRILYGGSVKPENISEYMRMEHIDGALVGGASLEPNSYLELVEACVNV